MNYSSLCRELLADVGNEEANAWNNRLTLGGCVQFSGKSFNTRGNRWTIGWCQRWRWITIVVDMFPYTTHVECVVLMSRDM